MVVELLEFSMSRVAGEHHSHPCSQHTDTTDKSKVRGTHQLHVKLRPSPAPTHVQTHPLEIQQSH